MYDTVQRKATFMCYQINPDSIHLYWDKCWKKCCISFNIIFLAFIFPLFSLPFPCLLWWYFSSFFPFIFLAFYGDILALFFHPSNNTVFKSNIFGGSNKSKPIIWTANALSDRATAHILLWSNKILLDLHILNPFLTNSQTLECFDHFL